MAWRFNYSRWVKSGFLDNTVSNKIVGELELASIGKVPLDLLYDSVVDDVNIEGHKPTLEECVRITLGEFQGRKILFQNPAYEPDSLIGGCISAAEQLADYALWCAESRGIVGLIRGIYLHPENERPMNIEFFNGRDSGGNLSDRSVIEEVNFIIEQ